MEKTKYSPWFKTIKNRPIRQGFYQCKCCHSMFWWNGFTWCFGKNSLTAELNEVQYWRGIIK
jgi:hypothetical protein